MLTTEKAKLAYKSVLDQDNEMKVIQGSVMNTTLYRLSLEGSITDVNSALSSLQYQPDCPFLSDLSLNLMVTAQTLIDNKAANGIMVSVTAGEATEVKGLD